MEGDSVEGGVLRSSPLEMHVVSYRHVLDILGDFLLVLLVDEDESVVFRIAPVIEHPFATGMIGGVLVATDRDVRGGRGHGCHSLEERRRLILHRNCMSQIGLDEVGERGYVSEMGYGVVLADGDREGEIGLMFGHCSYGNHKFVGRSRHDGGELNIHRLVATNGSTEGDGSPDLLSWRRSRLILNLLSSLGLWWGRGEACEISFNLGRGRGWFGWWE
jgi:hypothetical protein